MTLKRKSSPNIPQVS